LRGVILDLPDAVLDARRNIEEAALSERCQAVEGSFFDKVPPGDTYILSQILHDWDDEHSQHILRTCRRSIADKGRLLLVESVVPTSATPSRSKLLDLHMLVFLGWKERTEKEWGALLGKCGFQLKRVLRAQRIDVLEAFAV
jgi:hypothetical protein